MHVLMPVDKVRRPAEGGVKCRQLAFCFVAERPPVEPAHQPGREFARAGSESCRHGRSADSHPRAPGTGAVRVKCRPIGRRRGPASAASEAASAAQKCGETDHYGGGVEAAARAMRSTNGTADSRRNAVIIGTEPATGGPHRMAPVGSKRRVVVSLTPKRPAIRRRCELLRRRRRRPKTRPACLTVCSATK